MEKDKYKMLQTVRNSTIKNPVTRDTFYRSSTHIMDTKQYIDELLKCGFISEHSVSGELTVTAAGFAAIEAELADRRGSVRYRITTMIAIVAIIVSIVSLLMQLR